MSVAIIATALLTLQTCQLATIHLHGIPGRVSTSLLGRPRGYIESEIAYVDLNSTPPAVFVEPGPGHPTAVFKLYFTPTKRGLWAPTSTAGPSFRWSLSESLPPQTTPWPPDASLQAFREHLRLQYMPQAVSDFDAALAAGGVVRRTLWTGYLHNAAALFLAYFAAVATRRSATSFRQAARLARSLCPQCRYDLTGLPPQAATCPECGEPIDHRQSPRTQPAERAADPEPGVSTPGDARRLVR